MSVQSMILELNHMVVKNRMPVKRAGRIIAELLLADAREARAYEKLAVSQDLRALNIPPAESVLGMTRSLIAAVKDARAESRRLDQLAILMFRVCEEGMAALEGIRDEDLCVGSLQAVIRLRRARDRAEGDNASHEKRLDACYRAARGEDWKAELGELMPGKAVEAVVELYQRVAAWTTPAAPASDALLHAIYRRAKALKESDFEGKVTGNNEATVLYVALAKAVDDFEAAGLAGYMEPANPVEKRREIEDEMARRPAVIPIEAGRLAAANVPGPRHTVTLPNGWQVRAGDEVTLEDQGDKRFTVSAVFDGDKGPWAKVTDKEGVESEVSYQQITNVYPEIPF